MDPGDRGARLWRALALSEVGKYAEALEELGRAGSSEAAILFGARILYDTGRIDDARQILRELATKSSNEQAHALYALCLLQAGEIEEAHRILACGLPHAPWLLARLLLAIEERAGLSSAEPPQPIEHPHGRVFGSGKSLVRRGLVLLRSEKFDKAHRTFWRARQRLQDDPMASYGLGVSAYYLRHFEPARQWLLDSLDHLAEPYASDALAALGKIELEAGRDNRLALVHLRQAIARGAASEENFYALGLAALRCGRPLLARRAFEQCATAEFVRSRLEETATPAGSAA